VTAEQMRLLPPTEPEKAQADEAERKPIITLHSALDLFHEHMVAREWSPYTVRAFDSDLRLLERYLGDTAGVASLRPEQLEAFLEYLRHERGVPCNKKSLARRLTTLKVFFAWLCEQGATTGDLAAGLYHEPVSTPLPRILTDTELAQLEAETARQRDDPKAPDIRPLLLTRLLLDTGIKKGECMGLTLLDLDVGSPSAASILVRYSSPRQRHKERRLRVSAGFARAVPVYLQQYAPKQKLFECTARNLEYVLDSCEKRAGLPVRSLAFETLRWTFAAKEWQAGTEPELLRVKLGLSQISWAEVAEKLDKLSAKPL